MILICKHVLKLKFCLQTAKYQLIYSVFTVYCGMGRFGFFYSRHYLVTGPGLVIPIHTLCGQMSCAHCKVTSERCEYHLNLSVDMSRFLTEELPSLLNCQHHLPVMSPQVLTVRTAFPTKRRTESPSRLHTIAFSPLPYGLYTTWVSDSNLCCKWKSISGYFKTFKMENSFLLILNSLPGIQRSLQRPQDLALWNRVLWWLYTAFVDVHVENRQTHLKSIFEKVKLHQLVQPVNEK